MKTARKMLLMALSVMGTAALQANPLNLTHTGQSGNINGTVFTQNDPDSGGVDAMSCLGKSTGECLHTADLNQVCESSVGGKDYREFVLDINNPGTHGTVDLSGLEVCGSTKGCTLTDPGTKLFDLGSGHSVLLDSDNCHGSNSLCVLIPESDFDHCGSNEHLCLISKFDSCDDHCIDWCVHPCCPPTPCPEPASLSIGAIAVGLLGMRRRKQLSAA
jgi:hypothetical protein